MAYFCDKTQGIFVNQLSAHGVPYADAIVDGLKPVETRTKNMLSSLVGLRVAIVKTVRGKKPEVIGYATIREAHRMNGKWMNDNRHLTLIPEGSAYDNHGWAKWCYFLENPERCKPFPLPSSAIRHGRSWCEF